MPFLEMVCLITSGVLGLAILLMLLLHYFRRSDLHSIQAFGYIGNDVITAVFGLLLAFLIVSMYESNKSAMESVEKEANDLVCILLSSQEVDNQEAIHKEVQIYTETLLHQQWPAMVAGDLAAAWKLEPEMINPLYKVILNSKTLPGKQSIFQDTLPLLLQNLVSVHRLRLLQSDFHLPIQFWIVIAFMTVFTICFLAYMNPWQGLHSLIPIVFPSVIIALSLSLIVSLHFPFLGPFAVKSTPFESGYLNFNVGYNSVDIVPESFYTIEQSEKTDTQNS